MKKYIFSYVQTLNDGDVNINIYIRWYIYLVAAKLKKNGSIFKLNLFWIPKHQI